MAKALSAWVSTQITRQDIRPTHTLQIASVDRSSYVLNWNVSTNREFGAASASITLENNDGEFNEGGTREINVGDTIQLIEQYEGDATQFKRFYGLVVQRAIHKTATMREIELTCLDYISRLQQLDIDLLVEGTKVAVENEVLTPNFLPAPNSTLAQVFDFSKDSIADSPRPIIMIRDLTNDVDHPQIDGFELLYEQGQVKLGSPINALTNYQILARNYSYYSDGVYAEDVLEDILALADVYDTFLFNETTANNFINNHLIETFQNVEGVVNDTLVPNYTNSAITIRHTLTANVAADDSSIAIDSTNGLPTSGEAEINGDIFTWTGKTATTLTGTSGLKVHVSGDLVKYEETYEPGRVWYLTYSRVTTTLVTGDFSGLPVGITVGYVDQRFGRIILSQKISTASTITCTNNYSFNTLQATGIQLNKISFRSRELENRYEAIEKLRSYLAPNYIISTKGDDKIWATYVSQKVTADYTLTLVEDINYLEDADLFTHVVFYGKNNNPTNLMFNPGVDFVSTGVVFRGDAADDELALIGEEGNYYVYGTLLSGVGYITTTFVPVVRVNGIAIDNQVHQLFQQPVLVELTTRTETRTGCSGISKEQYFKSHTYFYYKVFFAHTNLVSTQAISLHDATGETLVTISPGDPNMDYARGVWHVPGDQENSTITQLSTATYYLNYSTNLLQIDYDQTLFKIDKSLIVDPTQTTVTATYEYFATFTNVFDVAAIIDGRFDTQVQTEFYSAPPSGLPYAIIDLGNTYTIQALDIVAGFFKPDSNRKFDIDMRFSLKYSLNNVDYFHIGDVTSNIKLTGGESASFEEDDLGSSFEARYLMLVLEHVKRIEFGKGIWPVAFTEIAAYDDIVIKGEATLIATTQLSSSALTTDVTLSVVDTTGFTEPASAGVPETAYIDEDPFTYTGLTATSFTGVTGLSEAHSLGSRVHQTIETDTTLYDDDGLLPKLGDRVFKQNLVSDTRLYDQMQINQLSKDYLREFYKQHTRRQITVAYAPYLQVGQTVSITDPWNPDESTRVFIEAIEDTGYAYTLTVARYPGVDDQETFSSSSSSSSSSSRSSSSSSSKSSSSSRSSSSISSSSSSCRSSSSSSSSSSSLSSSSSSSSSRSSSSSSSLSSSSSSSCSSSRSSSSSSSSSSTKIRDENYTREATTTLPETDADLAVPFTEDNYTDVVSVNGVYVPNTSTDGYNVVLFKKTGTDVTPFVVEWTGQSDRAPSISPIYLEVFNRASSSWQTLDLNSTASAGTDITLRGSITNIPSNYYSLDLTVAARVYQRAV